MTHAEKYQKYKEYNRKACRQYYQKHKKAIKARVQARYWKNPKVYNEYAKRYYRSHKANALKSARRHYHRRKSSPDYTKFLEVKRAQNAVRNAVKRGTLIRPNKCSRCGQVGKTEAHHHKGYSPRHKLDVVWLCFECHTDQHRKTVLV